MNQSVLRHCLYVLVAFLTMQVQSYSSAPEATLHLRLSLDKSEYRPYEFICGLVSYANAGQAAIQVFVPGAANSFVETSIRFEDGTVVPIYGESILPPSVDLAPGEGGRQQICFTDYAVVGKYVGEYKMRLRHGLYRAPVGLGGTDIQCDECTVESNVVTFRITEANVPLDIERFGRLYEGIVRGGTHRLEEHRFLVSVAESDTYLSAQARLLLLRVIMEGRHARTQELMDLVRASVDSLAAVDHFCVKKWWKKYKQFYQDVWNQPQIEWIPGTLIGGLPAPRGKR